ncbi:hypothetical protein GCK32_007916 [Trichostrongylus colubriformis]|uniref:Uncharacterized protein n=1 Tax=Trichostrongylus colubriformis TaxID=6319 RepID=A0AAN8G296_TRICO
MIFCEVIRCLITYTGAHRHKSLHLRRAMAGLRHATNLNSQRPVIITRPPPLIVPPTQLNFSSDSTSSVDSFCSPNIALTSKSCRPRYSVVTGRFECDGEHTVAQDRHIYDYSVLPCAHHGNSIRRESGNPHLFISSPLSPDGNTVSCPPCSITEDLLVNHSSKAHWFNEVWDGQKSSTDSLLLSEPHLHSGTKLATMSPTIMTPPQQCYVTASMNSSMWNPNVSSGPESVAAFSSVPDYCDASSHCSLEDSPIHTLPPAAYADSDEEPFIHTEPRVSYSQNSDGVVSDFFSQSENNSCIVSSEEASPQAREVECFTQGSGSHDFFSQSGGSVSINSSEEDPSQDADTQNSYSREDDDVGNLSLSSEVTFRNATSQEQNFDAISERSSRKSVVGSNSSSLCSPIAKRGRFGSSRDERNVGERTFMNETLLLNVERYHSEYARDTYAWLRHRETTKHALGASFMDAQKEEGASWADRRSVVMKALVDMKKQKHSLEAIHLGAYILDKCLDSFHIAKTSLADVCAVSMVLGTKMEEYDSLRPGNVDGMFDATSDKARLCDIEKRIVHEMKDGLCFPTPLLFANYMLVELCCDDEQIRFAEYLLELALLDSQFRDEGGPRVAHAAVCMSFAIAKQRDSIFISECDTLVEAEEKLFDLTKIHVGSTRNVMRRLVHEMDRAVQEKHALLIDYLSDDNKRVCFCEVSPPFWNLLCGVCKNS